MDKLDHEMTKILIIDDNPASLSMIKGILDILYKVYTVNSGEMALQFLEKQRPDMILLDIEMPGMNDFLSKPIDKGMLNKILQKWLPEHKIEINENHIKNINASVYTQTLAAVAKINGIDVELALERIGRLQDVLEISIKQLALTIDERLFNMKDALSAGDLQGFNMEAHGLKGALANIGAIRGSEMAAELESISKEGNIRLCSEKFQAFSYVMESLADDLKLIFSIKKTEDVKQGDSEFLKLKINDAILFLNNFEANDAIICLNELENYTFGDEIDIILGNAKEAALGFSYEKAETLLQNIIKMTLT